jgi:16S rRNA (guanine966-N2)-methyltransferase
MSLRLSGGRRLQSPPGDIARPTPSRVRLAVMNTLAAELPGCRWLDLFCGSGVMGCEALQHGASHVVAVDQHRAIAATARANLELVAGAQTPRPTVEVISQEVMRWLQQGRPDGMAPFALIYADPPYAAGLYGGVAEAVAQGGWLSRDGLLLLECSSTDAAGLEAEPMPGWRLWKLKRYGSSSVLMLEAA